MKIRLQNHQSLLKPLRKAEVNSGKKKYHTGILIFIIFTLLLVITQHTLGKFSHSYIVADSASAAKFDVTITAPEMFRLEEGISIYEYHFLSDTDIQGLAFQVTNNAETEILCTPHINGAIAHRVYVQEEAVTEFSVAAKQTVSFWLIIMPDGLDTNVQNAKLFVDIQQAEGR